MHAKIRLPTSGNNSPSPPASPRHRHHRSSKSSGRFTHGSFLRRFPQFIISVLVRRQGVLLFAPLLYISSMLFYMGTVQFDVDVSIKRSMSVGSVYRSPELYAKLRHEMDADDSTADAISTLWKRAKGADWRPCINKSSGGLPDSNGYIYIEANGGLNQQRTSICNAVAVAGFLNATLVIPNFHFHSIWRDPRFVKVYSQGQFRHFTSNVTILVQTSPN